MIDTQPLLFDLPLAPKTPLPEGFRYKAELIDAAEERELVASFQDLPFKAYEHLGYFGNRRIAGFGWRQDESGRMVETGEPIPDLLLPLLDKVAAFTGLARDSFRHALVTEYSPGAGIGWHRDRPPAVAIAGVSLLSPCHFRLRRKAGDRWDRASIIASPRSAYLMAGPARSDWQHSIPALEALRYSVTFRTVRR
ncbi:MULTISPECIES: alpha-ketoglutarate-dependent dioxygenase AlkB [unclassified Caulobacter]|jgi:alkylated DNA repair dioxygenase AlkB|uniref:alpha-ketoglutarate-dependent dioxygenase AlkB n=1 Tax=unclassified Caulobacter TaxID=2648921 RepID=UPI000781AF02|nr:MULTISPECIES: alpha-ketoglutarate-dependent dioxygenase AlkB [unclassified Caulobacter]AZS21714.1 alpha-ketoglutarate-dependent dioxygenase AlkB [Caulobacter sp. FWC26]